MAWGPDTENIPPQGKLGGPKATVAQDNTNRHAHEYDVQPTLNNPFLHRPCNAAAESADRRVVGRFGSRFGSSGGKAGDGGSSFRDVDAFFEDHTPQVGMADEIYSKTCLQILAQAVDTERVRLTEGKGNQNHRWLPLQMR